MAALISMTSGSSLMGKGVGRNTAFTSARTPTAPRQLIVRAQQGPSETFKRTIGALAAAQLALLPLSGSAVADVLPSTTFDTQQPQKNVFFGFGEKVEEAKKNVAEAAANKSDPAERVTPEGRAPTNESQQTQAEDVRREAENGAPNGGDARAPTGPQKAVSFDINTASLQKNVLFGFDFGGAVKEAKDNVAAAAGEKSDPAERVTDEGRAPTNDAQQAQAEDVRREAENGAPDGGDARAPTGPQKAAPIATIGFDTTGLQKNVLFGFGEKVEQAKENVKQAAEKKSDPAERVVPEGRATTNEAQQTQAEDVKRQSEGATPGGDARAPTGAQPAQ